MGHFICRGNAKIWLVVVILCILEVGLWYYYQNATGNESLLNRQKITVLNIATRLNTMRQEVNVSNFMENIWEFPDYEVEKMYLYRKLLTQEHSFNEKNLQAFRSNLRLKFGTYFNNNLIIDQQNTPHNYSFKFGPKKKLLEVKISEDVHRRLPNNYTFGAISRCSIVGNSGSILHSRCGKKIDEADFVFRCNAAPIGQFGIDAGFKTNFTTFNPSILRTRYRGYPKTESVIRFLKDMKEYQGTLYAPCFSADSMAICINITKYYNLTENNFVLGYPSHLQRVQSFWRSRGLKGRISTGFYLVNVALSQCRELNLYGFWPFLQDVDKTVKDIPYHYFDKVKHNFDKSHSIHDMHYEFSVLVQLHLLGVLKINVGSCSQ